MKTVGFGLFYTYIFIYLIFFAFSLTKKSKKYVNEIYKNFEFKEKINFTTYIWLVRIGIFFIILPFLFKKRKK